MIIDYQTTSWGHNHYLSRREDGLYSGACFNSYKINVGDTIIWSTNYGHVEAVVCSSTRASAAVADMYNVVCRVTRRVADTSIVSQEEIDEYFGGSDE